MPRYKCESIAALDIALGGLPAEMQVEADVGAGVSAKTVGELRKDNNLAGAFFMTNGTGLLAGQLGAAYFIPTAIVPLLLITHGLVLMDRLLRPGNLNWHCGCRLQWNRQT